MNRRDFVNRTGWIGLAATSGPVWSTMEPGTSNVTPDRLERAARAGEPGVSAPEEAGPVNGAPAHAFPDGQADRRYWIETMDRITAPVLERLAAGTLRASMPVEIRPGSDRDRRPFSPLEAFGRTMAGVAPWLALGADDTEEGRLRSRRIEQVHRGLAHGLDPASPDYFPVDAGSQILVDAAFLAHALLRAPDVLWETLDAPTRRLFVTYLQETRRYTPGYNNWLLFSAMVEAALLKMGEWGDGMRVDLALRTHREWYLGGGTFGDGPYYAWDYYNSFVIQPFMLDVLGVLVEQGDGERHREMLAWQREVAQEHARYLERMIGTDGSFPPIGRSISYRFGAFQLLAQVALQGFLPDALAPGAVRSALTAVIRRTTVAASTFDENGWLRLGLSGHQPELAETYVSTGSLYLCTTAFLPLGLPATDRFWTDPKEAWTAKRLWGEP